MRGDGEPLSVAMEVKLFSSRRRHTRCLSDWSSDVCSSDLIEHTPHFLLVATKFSRQLHISISHSGLPHCEIEYRLRSHWRPDGSQSFAPRRFRCFRDLPSAGNPSGDRLLQTIRSLPKRIPLS